MPFTLLQSAPWVILIKSIWYTSTTLLLIIYLYIFAEKAIKMFNIKLCFCLTDFCLCFYSGNYKVQRWDIQIQDFLESAPGLGMIVTVKSPSAEVNMLYECFCMIYEFTFGTGKQHYLKIIDNRHFWGNSRSSVYQLFQYFDDESYKHLLISIKVNRSENVW